MMHGPFAERFITRENESMRIVKGRAEETTQMITSGNRGPWAGISAWAGVMSTLKTAHSMSDWRTPIRTANISCASARQEACRCISHGLKTAYHGTDAPTDAIVWWYVLF